MEHVENTSRDQQLLRAFGRNLQIRILQTADCQMFQQVRVCIWVMKVVYVFVCLTVSRHANNQAFLQTAVLAAISARSVNRTVFLTGTRVGGVTLLTPSEETLRQEGKVRVQWDHCCIHCL